MCPYGVESLSLHHLQSNNPFLNRLADNVAGRLKLSSVRSWRVVVRAALLPESGKSVSRSCYRGELISNYGPVEPPFRNRSRQIVLYPVKN